MGCPVCGKRLPLGVQIFEKRGGNFPCPHCKTTIYRRSEYVVLEWVIFGVGLLLLMLLDRIEATHATRLGIFSLYGIFYVGGLMLFQRVVRYSAKGKERG